MKRLVVIQARLGSSRLPRKVLEDIGGYTALEHVWCRAVAAAGHRVVVACPKGEEGAMLQRLPRGADVVGWEGPEDDVLGRIAGVTRWMQGVVVRVTADCPWVDVATIKAVGEVVAHGYADFATTNEQLALPLIDGYDVEAFTAGLLRRANQEAELPGEREHVTPWMRAHARNPFVVRRLPPFVVPRRWTLDTADDLAWMRRVAELVDVTPPHRPSFRELLELEREHPELRRWGGLPE